MRRAGVLIAVAVLVGATLPVHSDAAPRTATRNRPARSRSDRPHHQRQWVPGQIVVRFRSDLARTQRAQLRANAGTKLVERLPLRGAELVSVRDGTVADALDEYRRRSDVLYAEPNYLYRATAVPNDPSFGTLWGLDNTGQTVGTGPGTVDADIDAPEAWDATTGSKDIIVAHIDSGITLNHPDLTSNLWANPGETGNGKESNGLDDDGNGLTDDWRGWDWIESDNAPFDLDGHGTHVAGTIAARGNNATGTTGVNWSASLVPLRVLAADGFGTAADVASAITYARDIGARVVNLSLGGPDFSLIINDAIAASPNVLVVAAAGNEGKSNDLTPVYPCNLPQVNVLCVAASGPNDGLASFSNSGALSVDLAAPGIRIVSTTPALATPLIEGFESGLTTWTSGGTGQEWGRLLDEFGFFASDSPTGNYSNNSDSWLQTTDPIDLTTGSNCRLTYVAFVALANGDSFSIEVSDDASSWEPIDEWTGSTNSWVVKTKSVSQLDGRSIYLRLRLVSDALLTRDGVSLDDLRIDCLSNSFDGSEYDQMSGTSMATPHVAGAAALMLSLVPDATVAALRDAILTGADIVPALVGRTTTGGRLNVHRSLELLFGGPLPTAVPSPLPSTTPSTLPSTGPPPEDEDVVHARTVSLRLRRKLIARGRVRTKDGFSACAARARVRIFRNGRRVASTRSNASGAYRVRLRARPGRYVARIPRVRIGEHDICAADRSSRRIR